jgi:hypothetical protein
VAAVLLTLTAVVYALIPLIVDIGPTHIFHPAWSPHARFHVVWQLSVNTMLGILAVLLIWWPGPSRALRLRLGALPGCIALGGFFVAALTRPLYGGTFSEPGGVPPVAGMDANLVAFTPTLLIQLAGLALALLPRRQVTTA